jgi:alcohol dehydrogenase, propanol-preferring
MLPKTMKAAVSYEFGQPLKIENIPVPTLGDDDVLVKVVASGVCHTDLHAVSGDWPAKPSLPFIPGHEGAGIIVAIGKNVKSIKAKTIKEGDRVGVPWLHTACRCCHYCGTGWETLCSQQKNTGYSVNGCFAEYVIADPNFIGHIPDNLDFFSAAPVLCAGVTVYKGLKETEVRPGEWVAISGIGGLGHLAVQYAKALGMHCVAIDNLDVKLALASQLGADLTLNINHVNPSEAVQKAIGGVHGVLVTAVSPDAINNAFGMLRSKGTMAIVGLPPGRFAMPIFDTVLKRITVRGSIVGTRVDLTQALQFSAEGKVKTHYSVSHLHEINDVLDQMKQGEIEGRVVLDMAN